MDIRDWPLPYAERLAARSLDAIDLVVIHCTELPDLAMAREYGERVLYDAGTGNSGHFYIDRDGSVSQWVPLDRVAHHCRGYNEKSIGIELVNLGRYPEWFRSDRQAMAEDYPEPQIDALTDLIAALLASCPTLRCIDGHEDLDTGEVPASDDAGQLIRRKKDPGPRFPWARLLENIALIRTRS